MYGAELVAKRRFCALYAAADQLVCIFHSYLHKYEFTYFKTKYPDAAHICS